MREPWNDSSVLPPPVNTFQSTGKTDISGLSYTADTMVKILIKQLPIIRQEYAIFSRFVYKYDKKFRNDLGYRSFRKVYNVMGKYLKLDLLRDIQNFVAVLPSIDDVFLPTRQMLEYILVRLLTFSKILMRLYLCSKQGAVFYLNRIKRGESHWMSLMPYALLSRVWSVSSVSLQHVCGWYTHLYKYLEILELKGLNFLPKDYTLPTDLEEWLGIHNLDQFGRFNWSQKKCFEIDSNLMVDEDSNQELADSASIILKYVNDINKDNDYHGDVEPAPTPHKLADLTPLNIFKPDHGEVISRDIFKSLPSISNQYQSHNMFKPDHGKVISRDIFKSLPSISNQYQSHLAQNVICRNSLLKFIDYEEKYRNSGNDCSLTEHLSFMQWQALKNVLLKLNDPLFSNK